MTARLAFRVIFALVTMVLGTACGVRPTGVIGAGEPAVAQQAVPQTTVYLVRGGALVPVRRVAFPGAPQAALYDLWQSGPTGNELAAGMWSPLANLVVHAIRVRDGILTVEYERDQPVTRLLMAQVVCSGTAQPDIRRVRMARWKYVGPESDQPPTFDDQHPSPGWTLVVGRQRKCSDYGKLMAP
ncbi:hypothetical protein AB0L00_01385 [Actinoallomurus sp. NPDC052308]|uniref:hypothetical protein n=1 Tax=Actinoallomurus sp. NPDC052308 TaxID=3155530 RepID=UPI0034252319